jgi:MFS family permease
MGGEYGAELGLSKQQIGEVFGASLWPIALTMIGFSLFIDRTGYKFPMLVAFVLQVGSGVGTYLADSYFGLYFAALAAGLGHGIVEAVINPVCAAVYPREKTKWLTILHAAWPAGLVLGTLLIIGGDGMVDGGLTWRAHALWILVPAVPYLLMYLPCKFPTDERVQAGVPYIEMLRQVGFLTAFLASGLMIYEIGNQVFQLGGVTRPDMWFEISLGAGAVVGAIFGMAVKSFDRPVFFLMCLLMIPVATAELGTDGWIKGLMAPVLNDLEINPAMALVFSASIMLVLRIFAGGVLKFFSPPSLLCISGIFSAVGLYWLSSAAGAAVFVAFVLYALGQTYYWPCVLGFTSERYPKGGALTLNTVSAIGLLSAGIVGTPLLGAAFDRSIHDTVAARGRARGRGRCLSRS